MNLLDKIKAKLPVSRATHEAELTKERERLRQTLAYRQKEIEAEREVQMKKLDEIVTRLIRIQWRPHEMYSTFGLELNLSAEMFRVSNDPYHRKAIAEAIGHQVQGEILRSRFIQ